MEGLEDGDDVLGVDDAVGPGGRAGVDVGGGASGGGPVLGEGGDDVDDVFGVDDSISAGGVDVGVDVGGSGLGGEGEEVDGRVDDVAGNPVSRDARLALASEPEEVLVGGWSAAFEAGWDVGEGLGDDGLKGLEGRFLAGGRGGGR